MPPNFRLLFSHLALALIAAATFGMDAAWARSGPAASCDTFNIDLSAAQPVHPGRAYRAKSCETRMSHGYPIPDPDCTPGAINPTVTAEVLSDPGFRTRCVRDGTTSAQQKNKTYKWYGIDKPAHNTGAGQTCELDHLVSLELGGADTLDNIWPQCGPEDVALRERYFKQKDIVENYLAAQVKAGNMDLREVQRGIAEDWTQYLEEAQKACRKGKCKKRRK